MNITIPILILTLLLTLTGCQNRYDESLVNSFSIKGIEYPLDNCSVTKGSAGDNSLFDIDLSCCRIGNHYTPNEQITTRNFIWFSLRSGNGNEIEEGEYSCQDEDPYSRGLMTFSGTVTADGNEMKIKRGKIKVQKDKEELKLSFALILENRSRLSGNYTGLFQD